MTNAISSELHCKLNRKGLHSFFKLKLLERRLDMHIIRNLTTAILAGSLSILLAAGPSIGLIIARGNFRINNSQVYGNATLLEGSMVETTRASSELHLNSGVRMLLAGSSLCRVYRDRLVLERGQGQVENASAYRVDARGLSIFPSSTARIALSGTSLIQVAALNGPVRVAKPDGLLVANIRPGEALEFDPQQAGAATAAKLTGCVQLKEPGHYLLTDETTGVTVELSGPDLAGKAGARIEATGTVDPTAKASAGAAHVIRVIAAKVLSPKCIPAPASAPPGRAPAAAAAGSAAKKAVIVGVAVAGAAALGVGIGVTRGEEKPPVSP